MKLNLFTKICIVVMLCILPLAFAGAGGGGKGAGAPPIYPHEPNLSVNCLGHLWNTPNGITCDQSLLVTDLGSRFEPYIVTTAFSLCEEQRIPIRIDNGNLGSVRIKIFDAYDPSEPIAQSVGPGVHTPQLGKGMYVLQFEVTEGGPGRNGVISYAIDNTYEPSIELPDTDGVVLLSDLVGGKLAAMGNSLSIVERQTQEACAPKQSTNIAEILATIDALRAQVEALALICVEPMDVPRAASQNPPQVEEVLGPVEALTDFASRPRLFDDDLALIPGTDFPTQGYVQFQMYDISSGNIVDIYTDYQEPFEYPLETVREATGDVFIQALIFDRLENFAFRVDFESSVE